ncbi:hypothetical protein E3N88_09603 [Mikania micrantha]|uniref:Uncharacterized protein n=1 Tax=Mikania micrantha TaxID=192012 RepID=A0A5N6PKE8_9ASTR|nr:hypothetical protein E3N88_09603 [Mikania micrantha]
MRLMTSSQVTRGGGVTGWYQSHRDDVSYHVYVDDFIQYLVHGTNLRILFIQRWQTKERDIYIRGFHTSWWTILPVPVPDLTQILRKAVSLASHASTVPPIPALPEPVPVPPPPPALPIIPSPPHSPPAEPVADQRQSITPPRVPAWDGLRRMRGQARKTTGLPPRHQMAPRDEPQADPPEFHLDSLHAREIALLVTKTHTWRTWRIIFHVPKVLKSVSSVEHDLVGFENK